MDIVSQEQEENTRPVIKNTIGNFEQDDIVFVGYPIRWSAMPMIMYSFFDEYDFSGKTITPFCTHGGRKLAATMDTISESESNAAIYKQALSVSRNDIQNSAEEISQWIEKTIKE